MTQLINWGMALNDTLGDCVVAALAHADMIWGRNRSDDEVRSVFGKWCDPSGCDTVPTLRQAWWAGWIGGFVSVSEAQMLTAIDKFGCAFVTVNNFAGSQGSHTVLALSVDKCVSWGAVMDMPAATITQRYAISPKWSWLILRWLMWM